MLPGLVVILLLSVILNEFLSSSMSFTKSLRCEGLNGLNSGSGMTDAA